jgi:phage-related protein
MEMMEKGGAPKPLIWLGDSKARYREFPTDVQREMGYALFLAQLGGRHRTMTKTLSGLGGASTIEVRENSESGTYRTVYTVRYIDAVYVLHAFQKKSKAHAKTPKPDMDLIEKRLKALIAERERQ